MHTLLADASKKDAIQQAARYLREGSLVAFPTETVYGLGADALNADAVRRIFAAKGRPPDNPLIVHIADGEQLPTLVREIPAVAQTLMDRFWPGPLTLLFKKSANVPGVVTALLDTIAVRMPNHPVALALIRESGTPIAAPSANVSGKPSPTSASHVMEDLSGKIEFVLDGGETSVGVESTVLDITQPVPVILRPGGITKEAIERVIGRVVVHPSVHNKDVLVDQTSSPGMKYRHYAPRGSIILVEGTPLAIKKTITTLLSRHDSAAVLTTHSFSYPTRHIFSLGTTSEEHARRLFSALRECDATHVKTIFVEGTNENGLGLAFMNRVRKAASRIVHV